MQNLFNAILKMSVSAVPVIVAVLCLRRFFKRYPKSYSFALWIVVFASLAVPFKFPVNVSLPTETAAAEITQTIVQEFAAAPQQNGTDVGYAQSTENNSAPSGITAATENITQQNSEETAAAQQISAQKLFTLQLWHIWVCGILILLAFEIVNLKGIYDKTRFAFRKEGNIYLCDEINKPFVFGIVKPKIFIPSDISAQNEQYVTQHEQTHIDRRDYITKPLCFAVAAVHWFNPFVWLSFYLMEKDMELSCDEKVARTLDGQGIQRYCTALLAFAVKDKPYKINAVLFGEGNCAMRIKNILNFKQPKKLTAIMLTLCVLITGCTAFATGETAEEGTSTQNDNPYGFTHNIETEDSLDSKDGLSYEELWVAENESVGVMWFSDAAFVGDSATEGLRIYTTIANSVGDIASFVSAKNFSPTDIADDVKDDFEYLTVQYGIDALAAVNPSKIYTTFGTNALVEMSEEDFINEYVEMIKTFREKFPTAQIYVCSVPPVTKQLAEDRDIQAFKTEDMQRINEQLAQTANSNGAYYINLHQVLTDENGYLKEEYAAADGMHLTPQAYSVWVQYLMTHTVDIAGDNPNLKCPVGEGFEIDDKQYYQTETSETDQPETYTLPFVGADEYDMPADLSQAEYYTVQAGDTPTSIAKKFVISLDELYAMNPWIEEKLTVGDSVCVTNPVIGWPIGGGEGMSISRGFAGQYPSHDGLDIAGPYGTEIYAAADGKVVKSEESTVGDGNHIVIEHQNGYYTLYGHCSELLVSVGDEVKQGDLIAKMGSTGNSTGNHLHFELIFGYGSEQGGVSIDPYYVL